MTEIWNANLESDRKRLVGPPVRREDGADQIWGTRSDHFSPWGFRYHLIEQPFRHQLWKNTSK